jgi:polysaccharide transporter, PST family
MAPAPAARAHASCAERQPVIKRLKGLIGLQLVRNILALYGVRAVNQLLPLVVIPYLARVLGPTGWGLVAFAQAFAMYGIVTVEYGFEFAGTRAVAQGRAEGNRLNELVAGMFGTQLLLAGVVTLAAVAVQMLVPAFREQPLLLWAGLAFAVFQGIAPFWYFTGQERIALIAVIDTGAKLIGTGAVFLLVHGPADGWLVLAASAGASLISTGAAYALVLRQIRPGRLSLELIGRTLRLGASMFVMRIAVMMHTAGNVFLLGLLVAPQQVAFFAAGEKLCRPAAWLLQPINVALLPRLSHLVSHSPDQAKALAGLSILLMTLVGLGFGAVLGVAAPWLLGLMFGPQYGAAVAVMRVMALIVPLVVLNAALVSQWLVPHGLDRPLNLVILSATVLNLALALTLAPRFGAYGMAWVTVAVEGYILLGLCWALHRNGLKPITPGLLWRGRGWIGAERRSS